MPDLKLIALDAEDLNVVSAHLQDAVGRIGDIAYERSAHRFALVLNRFDWTTAPNTGVPNVGRKERSNRALPDATTGQQNNSNSKPFERCLSGLRFEGVKSVRSKGIDRSRPNEVLSLLAISYDPGEAPSGTIVLQFAGGPQIALDVDYIEAELRDLGAAWATKNLPQHPDASDDEN